MIYIKNINGVYFTIYCNTWKTCNSWGHEVTLYQGTNQIGRIKLRYYNRTWETYLFRTAIQKVIMEAVDRAKALAREEFKRLNGYKIITKKRSAEFLAYLNTCPKYQMFNSLYNMF